jgi:arylsulfatase A-like enzyme
VFVAIASRPTFHGLAGAAYRRAVEGEAAIDRARREYPALLTMCDSSLGRVLDSMDRHNLWDDTMLIVMTDHGLLLGEHGWWGKMEPPIMRRERQPPKPLPPISAC